MKIMVILQPPSGCFNNKKEEIQQILLEKPEELVQDIENKFGFKYVE